MKLSDLFLAFAIVLAPNSLFAQLDSTSTAVVSDTSAPEGAAFQAPSPVGRNSGSNGYFSRVAVGAGISPLGIELQAATNLGRHFNVRGIGNFFSYSTTFTTDGITSNGRVTMGSARAALDFYPFHNGLRLSPGVMFLNQNKVTAYSSVPGGTSFTLNGSTYYSANANSTTGATPVSGTGLLGLSTNKPAFTATAGWGNMIPRNGHWSFPVEVGVAFIGAPSLNVTLTGWACYDQAQTICTNIANPLDPIAVEIQSNLTAQVAKWTHALDPLKTYPIVSAGVAYSFGNR